MNVARAEVSAAVAALAALGVTVTERALAAAASERGARSGAPPAHLADLGLALACEAHDPRAVALFERTYLPQAARALRKLRLSQTLGDEVLGWLRFELFARESGALIATYSGRGDLGSWVRSIAVHEALKRAKKERREVSLEAAEDIPMPAPELVALRGAHGKAFTDALASAFAALTASERNLLRQYFLDGLTIDVLAGLHAVHRATAARRVAAARQALVDRVRATLLERLRIGESEVDEVITLSNLEQSLSQLLRYTRGGEGVR